MKKFAPLALINLTFLLVFFQFSCSKDSDLLTEYVIEESITAERSDGNSSNNTPEDQNPNPAPDPDSGFQGNNRGPGGNPDFFDLAPASTEPADGTTYTPTSSSDITNASNANKTAIISNSFDCSGCTFAPNQKIRPAGGVISGTNINLNGAYIDDVADQAFSSSTTFSAIYEDSWVYAEVFGATGNDASDDSAAMDALLDNVKFGKLSLGQTYVKNAPSFSDGARDIIFDLNGSKIEVTSDSGYDEVTDQQGMFMFHEANIKFFNGEIDGNDLFGALFRIGHPEAYHFENLWIHNLENEPYSTSQGVRVIAFLFHVSNADGSKSWNGGIPWTSRSTTNVFQNGYINNCTIEDLNATGTGLPSQSAQAMWWVIDGVNNTNSAIAYQSNNIIRRITGGESEGLYWNGGPGMAADHAMELYMENDAISDCGDRAIKATSSNITINNGYYSRINPAIGSDQGGDLVAIFTLNNFNHPTNRIKNVNITNTEFVDDYGNASKLLSLGDVDGVMVNGNTFTQLSSGPGGAIRLGTISTNPSAQGGVDNTTIQNNTIINGHIDLLYALLPTNLLIDNNTFNYTFGTTAGGIFTQTNSTSLNGSGGFTVSNLNINVTSTGSTIFAGILRSKGTVTNTDWSDITLDYSSSYNGSLGEFLYASGNLDSTNTFTNVTMTNATGTNSIRIDSNGSPALTDCFGDGQAVTVQ